MRVLVTGGAGYIGSVTTEMLLDRGHDVVVFDNLERGHRAAVDPRARLVVGDLRDFACIRAAMQESRPQAVMHFAAYALVGESMEQPQIYFRNNVVGGLNLAEAAVEAGVPRFVFSSTCATYGQPDRIPITEDTPQKPANPYGESKLALEKALSWYERQSGMRSVFLRYFNACGASEKYGEDHEPESHIIPNIVRVALGQKDALQVFGGDYDTPDGTCIRDYVHISDLAQAHLLALTSETTGAFNLGNGTGFSVNEVIEAARRITGHPVPTVMAARRPGDPARLVAGADRARTVLGWKPCYPDLSSIIQSAWNWHRRHPHGYAK